MYMKAEKEVKHRNPFQHLLLSHWCVEPFFLQVCVSNVDSFGYLILCGYLKHMLIY